MLPNQDMLEKIDRYLAGTMDAEERSAFEQLLAADDVLKHQVNEQRYILQLIKQAEAKTEIKRSIAEMKRELPAETGKIVPISKFRRNWALMAGAAAVTVLAVVTTISMLASTGYIVRKQKTAYQELQRDIANLQKSQKQIIKDINATNAFAEPADYAGTAVAISSDGYLITSYHMVKNARRIVVENKEWGAMEAQKWITHPALDLAILKIDSASSHILKDLPISFSTGIADLGQEVYTLGFPREDLVYGHGSISSLTGFKNDTSAYQISIPVNPGNSGGPLFDSHGNLIGVISGRNIKEEGSAFAIKSSEIANYLATLDSNLSFKTVRKNPLSNLSRSAQLKKTQPYVFVVKVYTGTK